MIWDNIDKEYRRVHWHTAPAPKQELIKSASKWCRDHPSASRFYNHYTNTRWWFENKADAVQFALTWG